MGKKTAISLKSFNLNEMNKLDNQVISTNTKIEFIVYLQYDVIYSSLMNYSSYQIDQVLSSHCLTALSPNDLKSLVISYLAQPLKYNENEGHKQVLVQNLIQNWRSNNSYSEDQLIELFKDLDIHLDSFQTLQRVMNQKKIFQFSPLKKMIDEKIKNLTSNSQFSHYGKPRQNSEDLGNISPKRNSHAPAPMSLRSSSNVIQLEQDELVKKYQNHTIQNKSELESTPQNLMNSDILGGFSNQLNKSKTNRIQESIRQIASPKLVTSSTSRNKDLGYMNFNNQPHSITLNLKNQNATQLTNGSRVDHNYSGINTPVKDFEIKQITQKYLNGANSNGKPPLTGYSVSGLSSHLQTETNSQNNYDLKRLLSPTLDRSSNYSSNGNGSQIRFLSPGPVLESNTSKNQSQLNEYFTTEQSKRPQKNYAVQKREISLNDQTQQFKAQYKEQDQFSKTSDDGFNYRIKSPQPTEFSKRESDIIGNYSQLRLDTSNNQENATTIPLQKLKSENDLDLLRQKSPKITPIVNSKGTNSFAGSAVTSPLTKKFAPNFNSESKGFDIQPYRLIDLNNNNDLARIDLSNALRQPKERDSSLGVQDLKGFSIYDTDSSKNIDIRQGANFQNIKINSTTEIQQLSEPLNSKRRDSSEQHTNLKAYSTNQLFSKALLNPSTVQNQSQQNGFSNQRVSTLQNLFSSSNLDNTGGGSTSAISDYQQQQQQLPYPYNNNPLPNHLLQERTSRKISILNSIHLKPFAISEELKLALA